MFIKYPRTPHIHGSRLQVGDDDLPLVRLEKLQGGQLYFEEKLDGANVGLSFVDGMLQLQSRGHYLNGGPRERQFARLKAWAAEHEAELYLCLGERYILFGEWCFAVHSVFYDQLPAHLMEFDIYDRQEGQFLGTPERRALLSGISLCAVPVVRVVDLERGEPVSTKDLNALSQQSLYKSSVWRENFVRQAGKAGVDPELLKSVYDNHDAAEGLYIKHEKDGVVIGRYKWVRPSFTQTLIESGSHWSERTMIVNLTKEQAS